MSSLCYKLEILISCLPIKFSENCMRRNIPFSLNIWGWLIIKVFHWFAISWHYYGCTFCLLMMLTAMNVQLLPWQKEKRSRTSFLDSIFSALTSLLETSFPVQLLSIHMYFHFLFHNFYILQVVPKSIYIDLFFKESNYFVKYHLSKSFITHRMWYMLFMRDLNPYCELEKFWEVRNKTK